MNQPLIARMLADLDDAAVARLIDQLPPRELAGLLADWGLWARPQQMPPEGDWSTWVLMAGRGFGKTRAGAEWIAAQVRATPDLRIALVGATYGEARAVMIDGESGLQSVARDLVKRYYPSRRMLLFHNGSQAQVFSGASPEELRGPQHHLAWCDELAKWKRGKATWDMLTMGLRVGSHPRALVTTTPRAGTVLGEVLASDGTVRTGGTTWDNPHLAASFRTDMERQFGGTLQGRQELEGLLIRDAPGALWTHRGIAGSRWEGPVPPLVRVVIGVDPPSGAGTCGIVACARDADGRGHVLADHSITGASPELWAARVAEAAALHGACLAEGQPLVVAEQNQGGHMVKSVLLGAAPDLLVRPVTASRSKCHRAEPVSLQFEAGRAFFHGRFPALEAQLVGLIAGGDYEGPGHSPDRADAMVWALTELLVRKERGSPAVTGL